MTTTKIAIVIPALNEEGAIRQLLTELPRDRAEWIIGGDNSSTGAMAAVARAGGAQVACAPARGYGRACLKGFQTACALGAEIAVFLGGDGSDDPTDLPMMLVPVLESRAEMSIGSRVSLRAERGAIPPQALLGNWLVSRLLRIRYGVQVHDIGSFRAVRCAALQTLHTHEITSGWPVEMLIKWHVCATASWNCPSTTAATDAQKGRTRWSAVYEPRITCCTQRCATQEDKEQRQSLQPGLIEPLFDIDEPAYLLAWPRFCAPTVHSRPLPSPRLFN